jgi:hypothetical protein
MKTFAKRHRLVLPTFLIVLVGILFPWQHFAYANDDNSSIPPTQVIINEANVSGQGVYISWLEAQSGSFPIARYIIERSSDGNKFTQIGVVDKNIHIFTDPIGKDENVYQIIAEDNQKPAHRSLKSEPVASAAPQAGANAIIMPKTTIKNPSDDQPLDAKIAELQNLSSQAARKIGTLLTSKDDGTLSANLTSLQQYQRQILSLMPQLSLAQKTAVSQATTEQSGLITAKLYLLPSDLQMDGLVVQAGYQAIRDTAQ